MNDRKYYVALNSFIKFGPIRFKKLKKHFLDMENAFKASIKELEQAGIEKNIAAEFAAARVNIDPDDLMAKIEKENIKTIIFGDEEYPDLLAQIYDPPQILFCKGGLKTEDEYAVAVVGSRKHTEYGRQATEKIIRELSRNKLTIVSGLALGIDAIAHNAALSAGGRTIAVLGCGLDKQSIYPSANRYIADKISAGHGAVISEFPLGAPPLKHHFPQRNRLVAGLSLGVLVVEAGEKSGALITAGHALEQNREVFSVPGNIFSSFSAGSNQLLKMGAKTITCARDILETLDLTQAAAFIEAKKIIPETAEEKIITGYLAEEPKHINEIVRLTKLDINIINSTLVIMEMKGMVRNIGGMRYIIL